MTPPADLTDEAVLACVRAGWVVDAVAVRYLPVGFGSHHWEASDAAGVWWFVSADELGRWTTAERLSAAFGVAAAARAAGVSGAHGAVPDGDGVLVRVVGRWAVSVQPWLDGSAGRFSDRYTDGEAEALVRLLAGLHGVPVGRCPVESPGLPGRAGLEAAMVAVADGRALGAGPVADRVAGLLRSHVAAVRAALVRLDAAPAGEPSRLVVTHGEPHPGNVVRTMSGPVLVDWDTARVAEPERDLWLVAERTAVDVPGLYAELTGRRVDAERLQWRALRWALADVAAYVVDLSAAEVEDDDTAWQVDSLEETLAAL